VSAAQEPPATSDSGTGRYPVSPRGRELALLGLAALGVVYGDIGTSPLYALRECFSGAHAVPVNRDNVLGVLSLIFWTLVVVVTLKYHTYVLRLDNRGEGGILALMGLVQPERHRAPRSRPILLLGILGAALLYGDGIMMPAISVLSAAEGLKTAAPSFSPAVVPIAVATLVFIFFFQRRGAARVAALGVVMLVWFGTIALLGAIEIAREPGVLAALNPAHAAGFLSRSGIAGFLALGAVFLVATGAEALYADMGGFGRNPMRMDWLLLVGPALALNYFGQGALLLTSPEAVRNPFFLLAPRWAVFPLVVLAIAAAVIASQAVISGAFSLTRQAVQLGYLPRVEVVHTSSEEIGRIYIGNVNVVGMLATIALVVAFETSSRLAGAYGVAVATTMVITTLLAGLVSRRLLGWSALAAVLVTAFFLAVDVAFFAANLVKVRQGGWVSLAVATVAFMAMTTWRRGREILAKRLQADTLPLDVFLEGFARKPRLRVPGTAVFMDRMSSGTPPALLHNLKHNKAMHERVVFLTVATEDVPYVGRKRHVEVEDLREGFYRVTLRYGFMQDPDVPRALERAKAAGFDFSMMDTTFFLGRETLIPRGTLGMTVWRERLFALMSRNATSATSFFRLPPNRVVELGAQIEL